MVARPESTLGMKSDQQSGYLRVDEAVDGVAMQRPSNQETEFGTLVSGGRIGGGVGLSLAHDDATPHGVFAVGLSAGHALRPLTVGPNGNGCGVANTDGVVEFQLRYAAGWSVVLEPRVERGTTFCN